MFYDYYYILFSVLPHVPLFTSDHVLRKRPCLCPDGKLTVTNFRLACTYNTVHQINSRPTSVCIDGGVTFVRSRVLLSRAKGQQHMLRKLSVAASTECGTDFRSPSYHNSPSFLYFQYFNTGNCIVSVLNRRTLCFMASRACQQMIRRRTLGEVHSILVPSECRLSHGS